MNRKIFEKKFPEQSEAVKYLDDNNWEYIGQKGVLKKYYCYTAVQVWSSSDGIGGYSVDNDNIDELMVKLYSDGLTKVYATGDATLGGVSAFPSPVWSSYDRYLTIKDIMHVIRCSLLDHNAEALRENKFILFRYDDPESSKVYFNDPKELYEHALKSGITETDKSYNDIVSGI